MDLLLNNSLPRPFWNEFSSNNEYSSPFQSPEFYDLFNSVKTLSADVIGVVSSGSIKALAVITLQKERGVKGYFSRRGIIYGGPLCENNSRPELDYLLNQISQRHYDNTIYLESRNLNDYGLYKDIFADNGYRYIQWFDFMLATDDINVVREGISKSRSRQIKNSIRSGVSWELAKNQDEVKKFYDILYILYRKKIAKPLLPLDFFRNFFESRLGKYLIVKYKNRIIGGIMCPILKNEKLYELYICGLDEDYKDQHPSIMATWAAIDYACQNKFSYFDFMGAGESNKDYGVREFKARFGGQLMEYGRYIKINNPILYKTGRVALEITRIIRTG